jgi:hypothetical protein
MSAITTLKVTAADDDDVYRDIARINIDDRHRVPSGQIYKVAVGRNKKYLIVRGTNERGRIFLDERARTALQVDAGKSYDFHISRSGWPGYLVWSWQTSDPAYRIPAQLGIMSFTLGVLSLALALPSFFDWMKTHLAQ